MVITIYLLYIYYMFYISNYGKWEYIYNVAPPVMLVGLDSPQ